MEDTIVGLFFTLWNGLAMFGLCHLLYALRPEWFKHDQSRYVKDGA